MSETPKTDAAERFMYDSRVAPFGFIPSSLGRSLERELNAAQLALQNGTPYENALAPASELESATDRAEPAVTGPNLLVSSEASRDAVFAAGPEPSASSTGAGHDAGKVLRADRANIAQQNAGGKSRSQEQHRNAAPDGGGDYVEYSAGELLFSKGDPANHMAVIMEGSVEIFDPEHDRRIAVIGKGGFFGEQAILQGGVRAASVRAVDNVICLEIKTEKLRLLLSEDSGLLMPAIETLLLQLCMANWISHVSKKQGEERRFSVISESQITGKEIRKLLNDAYADANRSGFSSDQMLYLKLNASNKLHTVSFSSGQKLGSAGEEHPGAAYVVVAGEVDAVKGGLSVRLGAGGVVGLAEGFTDGALTMTYTAVGHVTALILPMDKVLRGMQKANPGIKAIVRCTSARIIELEKSL